MNKLTHKNTIFYNRFNKTPSDSTPVGRIILRVIIVLLLPLSFLLRFLAMHFPAATESFYSRGFYRAVSGFFSKYFNLFGFSEAEIIVYALVPTVVFILIMLIKRLVEKNIKGFFSILLSGLLVLSATYFVFTIGWSLNYYRVPLEESLGYKTGEPTAKELAAALESETKAVNSLCDKISFSEGSSYYSGGFDKVSAKVNDGYNALASQNSQSASLFGFNQARPKRVLSSELMSYTDIAGIFVPFTYEPNVNVSLPQFFHPFDAAHETAHFKGFAREEEANFLAYLSCTSSDDSYFQYSAHMEAYLYLSQALYETDENLFKERTVKLDSRAVNDFKVYSLFLQNHESKATEISNKVNDSYLKAQGQQGVISYNMFVKLLCDKYRTEKR